MCTEPVHLWRNKIKNLKHKKNKNFWLLLSGCNSPACTVTHRSQKPPPPPRPPRLAGLSKRKSWPQENWSKGASPKYQGKNGPVLYSCQIWSLTHPPWDFILFLTASLRNFTPWKLPSSLVEYLPCSGSSSPNSLLYLHPFSFNFSHLFLFLFFFLFLI